jgi:hypothetical protein
MSTVLSLTGSNLSNKKASAEQSCNSNQTNNHLSYISTISVLTLPHPAELTILITTVWPNSSVTKKECISTDIHDGDTLPSLVSGRVITVGNYPPGIPDHYLPGIPQLSSLPVLFMSEFMNWLVNSKRVLYKLWQTRHILH